jgi:SAM-dependent methyltransferase
MKASKEELGPALPPEWHALHYLPQGAKTILDVGCNVGSALQHAQELGLKRFLGIEINPQAAEEAKRRFSSVRDAHIVQGSADEMPFETGSADVAICFEVLEHVPESLRPAVVREAHRVLKQDAPWIITVPARGLFSFLDPANARLVFPKIFSMFARLVGGRGREAGFEDQKHGIVWHHHFKLDEIRQLLEPYFEIHQVRWRGSLLMPLGDWLQFPFYRFNALNHPISKGINFFQKWDMRQNFGSALGYNMIIVAKRKNT